MNQKTPYRPWGTLEWTLGLCDSRSWRFLGGITAEERSIAALIKLQRLGFLDNAEMLHIVDTEPENLEAEEQVIKQRFETCQKSIKNIQLTKTTLDAPLQNSHWKKKFDFLPETSFCLDVSSLPKRFFFTAIKAALQSQNARDFLIVYTKPTSYPDIPLTQNPRDWATISGFNCADPDLQNEAASRLIVSAGFAVDGLHGHLEGRGHDTEVNVLIPFPAYASLASVRRSWESAKQIEDALGANLDQGLNSVAPIHYRVGALDSSTSFDQLLNITKNGESPAALAPLGPKPISVAMCLLSTQTDRHPVYYAQPRTYTMNYSIGCEAVYAYWIKLAGRNLYAIN